MATSNENRERVRSIAAAIAAIAGVLAAALVLLRLAVSAGPTADLILVIACINTALALTALATLAVIPFPLPTDADLDSLREVDARRREVHKMGSLDLASANMLARVDIADLIRKPGYSQSQHARVLELVNDLDILMQEELRRVESIRFLFPRRG